PDRLPLLRRLVGGQGGARSAGAARAGARHRAARAGSEERLALPPSERPSAAAARPTRLAAARSPPGATARQLAGRRLEGQRLTSFEDGYEAPHDPVAEAKRNSV